jgi:hypothetical protein
MPDSRLQLTAQELLYAASALRTEALRAERQAGDQQFEPCRPLLDEGALEPYEEPARKVTRICGTGAESPRRR